MLKTIKGRYVIYITLIIFNAKKTLLSAVTLFILQNSFSKDY